MQMYCMSTFVAEDIIAQSSVVPPGYVPNSLQCWYESDQEGVFNVNKQPEFETLVMLFQEGLPNTSNIVWTYIGAVR